MCCRHPSHAASADRRIQAASSLTTSARHGAAMGPQARARPPLQDEATQASLPAFLALCPSLLFACLIFSLECRWNIFLWLSPLFLLCEFRAFFLLPCSSSPASFPHPSDMGQQCCTSLACFSSVLARPELCLMFDSVVWLVLLFPGLIFLYTTTMIFLVVLPPVNCGGKIIFYQEKWIHYICAWESAFVYQ